MSRSNIFTILFLFISTLSFYAQNGRLIEEARSQLKDRGEIYFCFVLQGSFTVQYLSDLLSITGLSSDTVFAYSNEEQFNRFLQLKIPFEMLTPPSLRYKPQRTLKSTTDGEWRTYPTYQQYIGLMEKYAKDFPGLCNLIEIGVSVGGKKMLAVKISDNVNNDESEPEVFYTSTMHGDEPAGFVIMLRLIDHILNSYGFEDRITNLVDHAEIFINPLANPDGLYFLSDTTVAGAKRFNLNNIDLNRGFPNPESIKDDSNQPEIHCMIDFMDHRSITLSANFHDGAEVVNYPWDMWQRRHADDEWYIRLSRQYADTVHKYSTPGYMDDLNNGITNGYEWYKITGGRQDYVNYYLHGREVTIELSQNRFPEGDALDNLWEYNKKALVNYLVNCFTGITGTVTDSVTGKPVEARIFINDHDFDRSFVYSDRSTGVYYRMINGGDYSLSASADGYYSKVLAVKVPDAARTEVNIRLEPVGIPVLVYPNPFASNLKIMINDTITGGVLIEIFDVSGKKIINTMYEATFPDVIEIDTGLLSAGFYILKVRNGSFERQFKILKIRHGL
ncbi:MAG: T9SS type A sorting domain-containing protein [Bacteroidales bacterium]|nr:T9SS type A sorting domain-containing protein [Bacteroidales bacterium]